MLAATIAVAIVTATLWYFCCKRTDKQSNRPAPPLDQNKNQTAADKMGNAQVNGAHTNEHLNPGTADPAEEAIAQVQPEDMVIDRGMQGSSVDGLLRQRSLENDAISGKKEVVSEQRSKSSSDWEKSGILQPESFDANRNIHGKNSQGEEDGKEQLPSTCSGDSASKTGAVEMRRDMKRKSGRKNKREAVVFSEDSGTLGEGAGRQETFKRKGLFQFHSFRSKSDNPSYLSMQEEQAGVLQKQLEAEQKERKKAQDWAKTLATELENQVKKRSQADAMVKELKSAMDAMKTEHEELQREVAEMVYSRTSFGTDISAGKLPSRPPPTVDPEFLLLKKEHQKLQASYRHLQNELTELIYGDNAELRGSYNDLDQPILSPGQAQELLTASIEDDQVELNDSPWRGHNSDLHNNSLRQSTDRPWTRDSFTHGASTTAVQSTDVQGSYSRDASGYRNSVEATSRAVTIPVSSKSIAGYNSASPAPATSHTPTSVSTSLESLVNANQDMKGFSFDDVFSANLDMISDDEDLFDLVPVQSVKLQQPYQPLLNHSANEEAGGGASSAMHEVSANKQQEELARSRLSTGPVERTSDRLTHTQDEAVLSMTNIKRAELSLQQSRDRSSSPAKRRQQIIGNKELFASAKNAYEKGVRENTDCGNSSIIGGNNPKVQQKDLVSKWEDITKSFNKHSLSTSKRQSVEELNANVQERKKYLEDIIEQRADEASSAKPRLVRLCSQTEAEVEASIMSSNVDFKSIKGVNMIKSKFEQIQ